MKKTKTLNIVITVVAIFLFVFIATMCFFFYKFQTIPDTLVTAVLASGSTELLLSALIEIFKLKSERKEDEDTEQII